MEWTVKLKKCIQTIYMLTATVILTGCLFGCAGNIVEDEPIIIVDRKVDEITFNLDKATKGDVIKAKNINAEYVQTKEQQVAFSTGGKLVDKVYVREGDTVKVGDILVELKSDNLEEQILDLEHRIKSNELSLSFLDKEEEFDKEGAHINLIHSGLTGEDYCKYEDSVKEIERNYRYRREDLSDSISYDNKKLVELNEELKNKRIYAEMEGTVISIKPNLEGSTAKRDDVIMTVVDSSDGIFEAKDESLKSILHEGDVVNMSIIYGSAKGEYELEPLNINNWGETQQFLVTVAPEGATLEVGISGTIKIIEEKREDVIRIPFSALYETDDRYYTYTLDEDNMRKVQFLEIGLIGDDFVEVKSGLNENDKVIKK